MRVGLGGVGGGDEFYENIMYEIIKELKTEKVKPGYTKKIIHYGMLFDSTCTNH